MSSGTLRRELLDDPLARSYAGMTDADAATDLNDATLRSMPDITTLLASEIYDIVDRGEYNGLNAGDKHDVDVVLGLVWDVEVANGSEFQKTMIALFDDQSDTRASFLALTKNLTQSRGQELGISPSLLDADGVAACRLPDQPEGTP